MKEKKAGAVIDERTSGEQAVKIIRDGLQTLNLPNKIKSVIYTNDKGEYLVHLLNYEYDSEGFKTRKDVKINKEFFKGNYKFYYASLENPELKELDASNPTIPEIKIVLLTLSHAFQFIF